MSKLSSYLSVVAALMLLLAGCRPAIQNRTPDDPWGFVEVQRFQSIEIGVSIVTSGDGMREQGEDILRGAELAIVDYGRIDGLPIELVLVHVQCSEAGGRSAAISLTEDSGIVAVLGPTCSSSCQAAAPIYDQARFTTVSPSCSASILTDQVAHSGAFLRTIYDDSGEAEAAARFAYFELGRRRAALIDDGTLETNPLTAAFETNFVGFGGAIEVKEKVVQGDTGAMARALSDIEQSEADLVYAPLMPGEGANLVSQRAARNLAIPVLGGRHFWTQWFADRVGENGQGIYAVGPLLTSESYAALKTRYQDTFGAEPSSPMFAYSYDATILILTAIEKVRHQGARDSLLIGRQALRDALYASATYPGITGTLTCTRWGDCGADSLGVAQFQGNDWVVIFVP